ncbi:MAG TPA: IS21 family transposase [Chloroflexota bacterium]|nr:IS21 family transposase [Chloroflexota bacterium]
MELKALHAHGWSISALAREFGLSRNTVRREIASSEPRRYPSRVKPTALNEAQQAHVVRRLTSCVDLRGTILYHELCQDYGYLGSYPAFIRHLRPLRPASTVEPVIRFETDPGQQVQADWADLGPWPVQDTTVDLFGFVAILGFSRVPAVRFAIDHTRSTTLACVVRCLDDLGGVPAEILTDRDGVFCIGQTSAGQAILAPDWVDLCDVLGVIPRACRPYRAKTKGKVERMVREVKESFLGWLSGQILPSFPTLGDYDHLAQHWVQEMMLPRRHRTTKRIVGEAWQEERLLLRPVAPRLLPDPSEPVRPAPIIDLAQRRLGEHVEVRDLAEYEVGQ